MKKDPTRYQRMEDLEEVMKLKEDDNYSEKSQEFFKEVKGEYDAQIFEENFDYSMSDADQFDNQKSTLGVSEIESRIASPTNASRHSSFYISKTQIKDKESFKSRFGPKSNLGQRRSPLMGASVNPQDLSKVSLINPSKKSLLLNSDMIKIMADLQHKEKVFQQKLTSLVLNPKGGKKNKNFSNGQFFY